MSKSVMRNGRAGINIVSPYMVIKARELRMVKAIHASLLEFFEDISVVPIHKY
jgi:hypothetical protein